MNVCLLLIGDGRSDYRDRTLESARLNLPPMDAVVEVDDSGHELGFAGAVQAGWDAIPDDCDYVFHLELDFTFNRPVPLDSMIALLERARLSQVALKRQPWNPEEKAAGGICELKPSDFTDHGYWTSHRKFFTTNPSVYPADLCKRPWPQESESEGKFTLDLILDLTVSFAFWGGKFDPPHVHHIGDERTGNGY